MLAHGQSETKQEPRYVITARQARGIPKKDILGHADPYVQPILEKLTEPGHAGGDSKSAHRVQLEILPKSKVAPNTAEPMWEYLHVIKEKDFKEAPEKCCVTFYVWDKDKVSRDDFIGSFSLPLTPENIGLPKWQKLTDKKGHPVGHIEVGVKFQKPISVHATAICKWCLKSYEIATNAPKSCMGAMYHSALPPEEAQVMPKKLEKKEEVESARKQCKWCNEFFTFASNTPTSCGGMSAHAARSKVRPIRKPIHEVAVDA